MANLTRYNPFSLARTDPFGDIDDLFKGFFMRPVLFEGQPQMQIKMDVKEDDNAYTVHADIPGVKKEDIHAASLWRTTSTKPNPRPSTATACWN
jgi:HSP20 family protein